MKRLAMGAIALFLVLVLLGACSSGAGTSGGSCGLLGCLACSTGCAACTLGCVACTGLACSSYADEPEEEIPVKPVTETDGQ